jgi:uncharacterized Zn finger protein (UPF0148 family)
MKGLFSPELEKLIEITIADGVLTDQEKAVLNEAAQKEGVDIKQLDVYIQYLLYQRKEKEIKKAEEIKAEKTIGGEVKKCPNCGAPYKLGTLVCVCGHMFDITIQSNAYQKFAEEVQKKISALKNRKDIDENNPLRALGQAMAVLLKDMNGKGGSPEIASIQQFIASYPVPNNRTDLLEFIVNLQGVANPKAPKETKSSMMRQENLDFGYYYWELFTSCINKAKVYFPNDKDFQPSFEYYNKKTQKTGIFSKLFGK